MPCYGQDGDIVLSQCADDAGSDKPASADDNDAVRNGRGGILMYQHGSAHADNAVIEAGGCGGDRI
jgi:hypothetical protein